MFRVRTESPEDEKTIRRQLWRVQRAVEDVRVRYALDDILIKVIITDLDGLGEATPALDGLANVSAARLLINERLFLQEGLVQDEELDDIITGRIAHELMHALHYARLGRRDLINLGRRYHAMVKNPEGSQREWVRTYERLTDMMTIRMGYGEELIYQKRASQANLAMNDPPAVWDFYLDEEINKAIDFLKLPSAEAARERPEFDADGDLIPRRRR